MFVNGFRSTPRCLDSDANRKDGFPNRNQLGQRSQTTRKALSDDERQRSEDRRMIRIKDQRHVIFSIQSRPILSTTRHASGRSAIPFLSTDVSM